MSLLFTNTEDIIRSRDPGEDLLETHGSTRSGMSTSLECHLKIYSASDFLNVPNSGTGNIIMEEDGPVIPLRNGTSSCNASRVSNTLAFAKVLQWFDRPMNRPSSTGINSITSDHTSYELLCYLVHKFIITI